MIRKQVSDRSWFVTETVVGKQTNKKFRAPTFMQNKHYPAQAWDTSSKKDRQMEGRRRLPLNTVISSGGRAELSGGFQVRTRGRSKRVQINGLCYIPKPQKAGGGQHGAHGEWWQLQPEARPCGSSRPWSPLPSGPWASRSSNMPDHRPRSGHPHGPDISQTGTLSALVPGLSPHCCPN